MVPASVSYSLLTIFELFFFYVAHSFACDDPANDSNSVFYAEQMRALLCNAKGTAEREAFVRWTQEASDEIENGFTRAETSDCLGIHRGTASFSTLQRHFRSSTLFSMYLFMLMLYTLCVQTCDCVTWHVLFEVHELCHWFLYKMT